jgi:two-component system, OmpR family, sensor histidine kinase BaeS
VTLAAFLGTQRGFTSVENSNREQTAQEVAAAAAQAYRDAGGWPGADLSRAEQIAEGAGARLVVRTGQQRSGMGSTNSQGGAEAPGSVSADVIVDGAVVGSVRLGFGQPATSAGRTIAWTWIAVAASIAIVIAVVLAWWLSRRLTRPLDELGLAVQAFGDGDRSARAPQDAPGEIGDLGRAFDAMAERVQRGEETRRALAHDVAHELRTPLAALQAGLEELRDGLLPPDPQTLAALHDQSLRMGRVVDDLGRLAEAEAPDIAIDLQIIDVTEVTRSAVESYRGLIEAAGISVTCHCIGPIHVVADPDRMTQVLANLLANAARYCRPGDQVEVTTAADSGMGLITVRDDGPGMNEEDAAQAFERFHRGAASLGLPGSGLGLAVVRALVESQGGKVTLDTVPAEGTTVRIVIPLA